MAFVVLTLILVSISARAWTVPAKSQIKVYNETFVKFPVLSTNTPSERSHESSEIAPTCFFNVTGPWKRGFNVTIQPIPPRVDEILKIHIDFHAFKDVWYLSAKGNLTRKGAPHGYSFDLNLCDYKAKLCPMKEGDTRHIDDSLFLPSAYVDKGSYSAYMALFDEDDKLILAIDVRECPIV